MGFLDLKFKEEDFTGRGVSAEPDKVEGRAQELKRKFDEIAKEMIALGRFNQLIDMLAEQDSATRAGIDGLEGSLNSSVSRIDAAHADLQSKVSANYSELSGRIDAAPAALDAKIADKFYNSAPAHNSVYRGKYLGNWVSDAQYAAISSGSFNDLYIGDYWYINNVTWRIAGFNYCMGKGASPLWSQHAVLVPDSCIMTSKFNNTNTTASGYAGSVLYSSLVTARDIIDAAFPGHHLYYDTFLIKGMASGQASVHVYKSAVANNYGCDVLSEAMLFGANFIDNQTIRNIFLHDTTQLPLFMFSSEHIASNMKYWLREARGDTSVLTVNTNREHVYASAGDVNGVRPYFCIG